MQLCCINQNDFIISHSQVKIICSYLVLLGMFLMFIPRTLVHECKHGNSLEHLSCEYSDQSSCESSCESSKNHNSPIFEEEECQICSLQFDVLDLPSNSFVENQLQISYRVNSIIHDAPITQNLNSLNTRGPPVFITL